MAAGEVVVPALTTDKMTEPQVDNCRHECTIYSSAMTANTDDRNLNERAPPEPARRSAVDRNSDGAPLTGLSEKAKMLVREVTGIPLQDAALGPFDIKCSAHAPFHSVTHTPSQHSRNGRDQSVNVMRRGRVPSRFRVHCWRVYFQSVPKACFVFSDSLYLVLGIIHRSCATLVPKIFAATFFPDRFLVYEVQHVCEKLASREEFRL